MAKMNTNLDDLFPSLEAEHVEEKPVRNYDFFDFERLSLQEVGDGEFYQGTPMLSDVSEVTFDDGVPKHRCQLWLIDYDAEEYLQININLKLNDDIQHNVHRKSSLYKLVAGINEQLQPGWSRSNNSLKQCDLSEIREFIDDIKSMTVQAIEVQGSSFNYFSFLVKEIQQ